MTEMHLEKLTYLLGVKDEFVVVEQRQTFKKKKNPKPRIKINEKTFRDIQKERKSERDRKEKSEIETEIETQTETGRTERENGRTQREQKQKSRTKQFYHLGGRSSVRT